MKKISLDGVYRLKRLDYGTDIGFVFADSFYPAGYLDAEVPGDVRTVLRAQGLIDGYYLGKDLDRERWIEESDWLYVRDFYCEKELEGKENLLCFEGIDTLSEIWLNGARVGGTDNMFLEYRFDVGALLRYGGWNTLAVKIISPVKSQEGVDRSGIYPQEDTTRMLLRKSQMNWGWDFCGHCLTGGIWKSVSILSRDHAVLKTLRLRTKRMEGHAAFLEAELEAEPYAPDSALEASIELRYQGEPAASKRISLNGKTATELVVENPQLWWPRPYGEAALYDVWAALYENDQLVDERRLRFGIRTVVLNQDRMREGGRNFHLEINGKKIFVRGANWVPLNCVYSEIKREEYDFYMKRVKESNLSMLRVWGGGIYEPEYFFDLCDENGIMVFQDFMLACGIYPQDDAFLDRVSKEVAAVVERYYNRASLVLWSADNELDEAYVWYDMQDRFRENRVNRIGVRRAVEEHDPYRPFLVSSPCSPFEDEEGGDEANSSLQGDMHIYLTRFTKDSEYYYRKLLEFVPRFMSEYGFSSLPVDDTYHAFNFFEKELDLMANPWLGELPWMKKLGEEGSAEEIIYMTQYTHAHALKYWIEYLRACKWTCGGSLYWKFNDPVAPNRENMLFPTLMSAIDFCRRPKLAYYYAKRAYENIILAFREEQEGLAVYGCNEEERAYSGSLKVEALDYRGNVCRTWEREAVIGADAATKLLLMRREELALLDRTSVYLRAKLDCGGQSFVNRFSLLEIGEFNQVRMPKAQLSVSVRCVSDSRAEVTVKTDCFAQDVMLSVHDTDVYFSDNAFCMDADSAVTCVMDFEKSDWRGQRLRVKAWNSEAVVVMLAAQEKEQAAFGAERAAI